VTSVRGSFWRFATLVLAVIVLLTIANTYMNQRRLEEHRVLRENLQSELDSVRIYLDYLAELLKGKPGLSSSDIEYFKERGLLDPVVDIKASLQEKKELIPRYPGSSSGHTWTEVRSIRCDLNSPRKDQKHVRPNTW